ncbi:hypothetical protein HZS_2812, partial [Henneguya salminicola]
MTFFKVVKTKSYFKRFQVKFKRRREGKTDYYQRKRLISQSKDKYNTRKYRLIVRKTNRYIICQIAYATINGDIIVTQSNSKELKRYGINAGFDNYAAAYATGLLLARRHLTKLNLANKHKGCVDKDTVGEDFNNLEKIEGNRAFKAVLDIGLSRSTTGAKIFGAMKGALDGGINVPHDPKRFVGNIKETKDYKPEVHREHIYGIHVANYMKLLAEKNPTAYQRQFSDYIKANVTHDNIEKMYKKAHELIRAKPEAPSKKVSGIVKAEKKQISKKKSKNIAKQIIYKRRQRVEAKKELLLSNL